MTHPSIQGLREAVAYTVDLVLAGERPSNQAEAVETIVAAVERAQAAYLTEHGVLLSGEGLVRAETTLTHRVGDCVSLVAVEGERCGSTSPMGLRTCDQPKGHENDHQSSNPLDHWPRSLVPVPQDGE